MSESLRQQIRKILDRFPDASPFDKTVLIMQIRTLFDQSTVQDAKDAIDICVNDMETRILLGAGMRGELYYYLAKRRAQFLGY